jgi:hypothetical protein
MIITMARYGGLISLAIANIVTTIIYLFICFIFFVLSEGHFEKSVTTFYSILAIVWLAGDGKKWFGFFKVFSNPGTKWNYYNYGFAIALIIMGIKFPLPLLHLFTVVYLLGTVIIHSQSKQDHGLPPEMH